MQTLIQNGTIVNAGGRLRGDVLIDGERIAAVGADLRAPGAQTIDAEGLYILPGGIDVHTHLELPVSGTVASDDYFTGQRAAAFGGTTTNIDFAIQPAGGSLRDGIAQWLHKAAGKACIDYALHANIARFRDDLLDELPGLIADGVTSLKMLMAYKGSVMVDDAALFKTLRRCADTGMLPMVHCENGDAIDLLQREAAARGQFAPRYHAATRPDWCEGEATHRAISLAAMAGSPLYVVHMTCAKSLDALRYGRARRVPVVGETCTQYFFFTRDHLAAPGFEGAKFVCSPPFRAAADQDALWQAIADRTLSVVATDHCPFYFDGGPHNAHGKELGRDDFRRIPNGVPGIEERMRLLWHFGVGSGRLTPERFVELTATAPARVFGLHPRKGAIVPGADADILLWDPEQAHMFAAATQQTRCDYTLYEGWPTRGGPRAVYLRGRPIVENGEWRGAAGAGQFIRRGLADWRV